MPTATIARSAGIDVHTAVNAAITFFKDAFGAQGLEHVQLEEVEKTKDGRLWLITLGYIDTNLVPVIPSLQVFRPTATRTRMQGVRGYKVITVDGRTGEVVSAKIRK